MTFNELPFSVYDCFTEDHFGGNVGVIVWNAESLNEMQMQKIAKEFNAPVTGYVVRNEKNVISARFFMPTSEIAMCGHVTIGLFTDLSADQLNHSKKYILNVPSGKIYVDVIKNQNNIPTVMFSLDIPSPIELNPDLIELSKALKINIDDINHSIPIEAYDSGLKHLFVNLINEEKVHSLSPDFGDLKIISNKLGIQTIACFAFKSFNSSTNLRIRDFCPSLGVNETPASGTTNGALIAYLFKNNLIQKASQKIFANQGSEIGRPSKIISEIIVNDGLITNLKIGGTALLSYFGSVKYP